MSVMPIILSGQCRILPTSYETLYESLTGRHRWGGFVECNTGGDCGACERAKRGRFELQSFADRVLVRIDRDGKLWLMNHPDRGWGSFAIPTMWGELSRIVGWSLGPRFSDAESEGFWLLRDAR